MECGLCKVRHVGDESFDVGVAVNNFDVLKRMTDENKKIQLCTTITKMNYNARKGGTEVSVGVPGNVCFEIESGRLNCLLLLFDIQQFRELKTAMEKEESKKCE